VRSYFAKFGNVIDNNRKRHNARKFIPNYRGCQGKMGVKYEAVTPTPNLSALAADRLVGLVLCLRPAAGSDQPGERHPGCGTSLTRLLVAGDHFGFRALAERSAAGSRPLCWGGDYLAAIDSWNKRIGARAFASGPADPDAYHA
jgi:hypothetical protein